MITVSILIPCYREREFIRLSLDSILALDDPQGMLREVLVLDGMSDDGTREIVSRISALDARVQLIDNPRRSQSHALNVGIARSTSDYIVRLDAHSVYPRDYLRALIETAERTHADNTGGVVVTLPRGSDYNAALVQALTTHRFGVGNSGFRTKAAEGPADTVPYGCFRRSTFDRVGFFDERLVRAQDYEMNRRIAAAGGVVWLNPAIRLEYFQQPGLRTFFRKQIVREAPYNAYMWYVAPYAFAVRHAITPIFAAGVIAGVVLSSFFPVIRSAFLLIMGVYFLLALGAAVQQAVRYREPRHVVFAPAAFFSYHFLHGLGVLGGLIRLATGRAPVQHIREPWPGAGRFRAWPGASDLASVHEAPTRAG